jgi:hypothetical protein
VTCAHFAHDDDTGDTTMSHFMHTQCTHDDDANEYMFVLDTHNNVSTFDDCTNIIIRDMQSINRQLVHIDDAGYATIMRERVDNDVHDTSIEYALIDGHVFVITGRRDATSYEDVRECYDVVATRVRAFVALHVMDATVRHAWYGA